MWHTTQIFLLMSLLFPYVPLCNSFTHPISLLFNYMLFVGVYFSIYISQSFALLFYVVGFYFGIYLLFYFSPFHYLQFFCVLFNLFFYYWIYKFCSNISKFKLFNNMFFVLFTTTLFHLHNLLIIVHVF